MKDGKNDNISEKTVVDESIKRLTEALAEEAGKRKKQILKRDVPEDRSLFNALMTLTRQELDDIRYNVGMSGTSNLKKSELAEKLGAEIMNFAGRWFVSMLDEQYQAFRHIVKQGGISTEFREDEMRPDYFQSIGVLMSGASDGKVAWYMPNEIVEEFNRLDNASFAKEIEWNSDVFRIACGILYYYGVLNYDQLFAKVKEYLEERDDFNFSDFMGVMYNGACWQRNVIAGERLMHYCTVLNPESIASAQEKLGVGFAKISYTKVYDAGEENYIESTRAYQELAQHFMAVYKFDVLKAAAVVAHITMIIQNGGKMREVMQYIDTLGTPVLASDVEEAAHLLMDFNNSLHMWLLKGHTPVEMMTGKLDADDDERDAAHPNRGRRVGRNDPCPCGSGKKYKNCCMRREREEAEKALQEYGS